MKRKSKPRWGQKLGGLLALGLCFLGPQLVQIGRSSSIWPSRSRIQIHQKIETIPLTPYAIVFGAAVLDENTLTDVTRERVEAAVLLYWQGKVRYLFISGDNRQSEQAEAMARYAIGRGVPESHVVIDPLGIDTQDSCRHFTEVDQKAVLVTQGFHLPRAMLMCDRQGIESVGLAVNHLGLLVSRGDSNLEILRIRSARFLREAALTWLYLLGIYERLSDEAEQIKNAPKSTSSFLFRNWAFRNGCIDRKEQRTNCYARFQSSNEVI